VSTGSNTPDRAKEFPASDAQISWHVRLREYQQETALSDLQILTFRALKDVLGDGGKGN